MEEFHCDLRWFNSQEFALSTDSIVTLRERQIGIGAFVMVECSNTGRFLMGRKAYREGFAYSEQLTFPGGMVRTSTTNRGTFQDWLRESLAKRHDAEMGIDLAQLKSVAPQDHIPPYIGSYIAKGSTVTTVVLPFHASLQSELKPTTSDPSVYDVAWRELNDIWPEVSPSNGLALANYGWTRLSEHNQSRVKSHLSSSYTSLLEGATSNAFHPPIVPWHIE